MKDNLPIILMNHAFGAVSTKSLLTSRSPMFFSVVFQKLYFSLYYIYMYDLFCVNFYKRCKDCVQILFFLKCGYTDVLAPIVEIINLFSQIQHCSFVKDKLTVYVILLLCSLFCSADLFVFSFTVDTKSGSLQFYGKSCSNLVSIVLALLGLLFPHTNFRISLLIFTK